MKINQEFKNLIPPLSEDEYNQLEKNCIAEGIRDSLVTWQGTLIDGHNRYEIATKHNLPYTTIEKEFDNENEVIEWIIYNQFGRRNLSNYQRSVLALRLEPIFQEKAKENQKGGKGGILLSLNSEKATAIDKYKEMAKVAGVGHDTIAKVKKIEQEAAPEVKQKLLIGEMSINEAYQNIRREEKKSEVQEKITELKQKEVQPTTNKYDVIVIDPPWQMEKIEREVAPEQVGFDYPTMTIEEISQIKLPNEKDCHVFMWITQKHHKHGWDILEAWGVRFICEFVWHKNGGFQPFNLPQFNHEYIMYGRIGNPVFTELKNFFTCFSANRTGHSKKPEEFYETIRRVTSGKRIDMFNRRKIEGFDVWGNES
jgi:N6-adenosine-specific RNA methylase IME4